MLSAKEALSHSKESTDVSVYVEQILNKLSEEILETSKSGDTSITVDIFDQRFKAQTIKKVVDTVVDELKDSGYDVHIVDVGVLTVSWGEDSEDETSDKDFNGSLDLDADVLSILRSLGVDISEKEIKEYTDKFSKTPLFSGIFKK